MNSTIKKTTSIKINQDIWQRFRILCLKKGIDASSFIEQLIVTELQRREGDK